MADLHGFLRRACALFCVLLSAGNAGAEPHNGWWWNPDESGRGFFIEVTDGIIYLAGYFYDGTGRATWLTSGGPIADPYLYQGRLQSYRSGQSVFGNYRPPDPAVDVGPVTLRFSDDTHGTITWPGGTIPIERVTFAEPAPATFRPKTGWWWNEAESGSGYSVEVQGSTAFVVSFMYDDAGNPLWYYTAGPMATATHYEGDWLQFAGGQTLTGPYKPPAPAQKLGRIKIDFATADQASIEFTEGASASASKAEPQSNHRSRRRSVRPLIPTVTAGYNDQWPYWIGNLTITKTEQSGSATTTERIEYALVFRKKSQTSATRTDYELQGNSTFTYAYHFKDTDTGCEAKADVPTVTKAANSSYFEVSELEVRDDLTYVGKVGFNLPLFATETETCPDLPIKVSDRLFINYVEFPNFQVFGVSPGRIWRFYPAGGYALNRPQPEMLGLQDFAVDPAFKVRWQLLAYP